MTEDRRQHEHMDAEDAQRLQQQIDTAQGPGPVLNQDTPAPMPLFEHDERLQRQVQSAIDPEVFAELDQRSGEELDQIQPIAEGDAPGVAGRAQQDPDGEIEERVERMG